VIAGFESKSGISERTANFAVIADELEKCVDEADDIDFSTA
jgi:hypothetical protein